VFEPWTESICNGPFSVKTVKTSSKVIFANPKKHINRQVLFLSSTFKAKQIFFPSVLNLLKDLHIKIKAFVIDQYLILPLIYFVIYRPKHSHKSDVTLRLFFKLASSLRI